MNEEFAQPAWADHHARLAADLSRGIAGLIRLFRSGGASHSAFPGDIRSMHDALRNQTVVVIGGGGGIGAAVATLAQAHGARVVAISRSGTAPPGIAAIAADACDRQALAAALAGVGTIDHLVHTAGARVASAALPLLDDDAMRLTFDTKLFSAITAVRQALPYLSECASITFTSGQVSRKYGTGSMVKGAANAAMDAAGRHLARELAPRRVNVISPGVVDTALWGEAGSEARGATLARAATALPVQRAGRPEELAAAYLFAMTNGFVTGSVIDVDGGGLL
jgi:NAD(P)-dependent dehydrogenase (short-subunit alcohol dehydrogenase family)